MFFAYFFCTTGSYLFGINFEKLKYWQNVLANNPQHEYQKYKFIFDQMDELFVDMLCLDSFNMNPNNKY